MLADIGRDANEERRRQLELSIQLVAGAPADALVDRCPLDFVAYVQTLGEPGAFEKHGDAIRDAIARIDLVVVVPIEAPDRIALAPHEDGRWRRRVDQRHRTPVFDDPHDLGVTSVEVHGTVDQLIRQVRRAMDLG